MFRKLEKYEPSKFMAKYSHYDKLKADRVVKFIENLTHTKGEFDKKKFELIDWQEQIMRDVFGIVKKDGNRQFKTVYIEIPKKQGKSELAAAVALYLLCADNEPSAEVYGCASDREQASLVYNVADQMLNNLFEENSKYKKLFKIRESRKTIEYPSNHSIYKVLSAEAFTKHGLNVSGVVFDELHTQPNRELYDVMTKGSGDARRQPLYFLITTAGTTTDTICWEVHQKAVDILNGVKKDDTFYPVIYRADRNDDWTKEEVWKKANPSWGITVNIDRIREACENAKQFPSDEQTFRQLRLNQWTGKKSGWLNKEIWEKCFEKYSEEDLLGRECYGGLDLSSTGDITAFSLVFPFDNDEYKFINFYFLPEETIAYRVKHDSVKYDEWVRDGFIITTEGNVIHYAFIENFIEELSTRYNIKLIAFDRWGATQVSQNLTDAGLELIPFGQGYKDMKSAVDNLEVKLKEKKLKNNGDPVSYWMFNNIAISKDPSGNRKFDKNKASEKIDGIVALGMALDIAIKRPVEESVYNDRGIISI